MRQHLTEHLGGHAQQVVLRIKLRGQVHTWNRRNMYVTKIIVNVSESTYVAQFANCQAGGLYVLANPLPKY